MPILPNTEFFAWHFMPYAKLPENIGEYESLWVDLPNTLFDPAEGHALYKRYIDELVLAEKLGFDGLCVNEHHATAYSLMPVPSIIAAALIPQTTRAKICVMGTPPGLDYPHRLAASYAMLDVMSGGRLEVAFPLGTPMEYWAGAVSPVTARERFQESLDIILRSWTEDGPIRHEGRFFTYRFLNVWPRPMQKPHPAVCLVGSGSPETIEIAAQRGLGYSSTFSPIVQQLAAQQRLRERAKEYGHTIRPDQIPMVCMAYVGETDEQAMEEMLPHVKFFFNTLVRSGRFVDAPGYLSEQEFRRRNGKMLPDIHGKFDMEAMQANFRVIAGSPKTVADTVERWAEQAQSSRVIFQIHRGDMPHWKVVKTVTLLAEEVIPELKRRRDAAPMRAAAE